jgi:hypothetical protein
VWLPAHDVSSIEIKEVHLQIKDTEKEDKIASQHQVKVKVAM